MKKRFIIFSSALITLCLTAYGYKNNTDNEITQLDTSVKKEIASDTPVKKEKKIFSDFIYDVGPRFGPIKKSALENVKSISDFISENELQQIEILKSVSIIVFEENKKIDTREYGISEEFNDAQLELLKSFDYSTNFLIKAEYLQKSDVAGTLENSYSSPHHTIVPEKQAEFIDGEDALKSFLKLYSEEARKNVDPEKLQAAKLYFTVTKKGTIENIHLDRTSNYPEVDEVMIKLISEVPGTWIPAENIKGERVDQELVVSFGLMGC